MPLRGTKAKELKNIRPKILITGDAKVGKTIAATQFPANYLIDDERGSLPHVDKLLENDCHIYEPEGLSDVMREIKTLTTEKHDRKTITIDPITTLYEKEVLRCERSMGEKGGSYGRHYSKANARFLTLYHHLTRLDMNVIVIAQTKIDYDVDQRSGEMIKVGTTFAGPKKLSYVFDIWFELFRIPQVPKKRKALVRASRFDCFKEGESFEWSFDAFAERFGKDNLMRGCSPVELSKPGTIKKFNVLFSELTNDEVEKIGIDQVLTNVGGVEHLEESRALRGIELMEKHLTQSNPLIA